MYNTSAQFTNCGFLFPGPMDLPAATLNLFQECDCGYIGRGSEHPSATHFLLDNYPILKTILKHLTINERKIFKVAFRDNLHLENSLHFMVCTEFRCNCFHTEIFTIK